MLSYWLNFLETMAPQTQEDLCFVGGHPRLPPDLPLPACTLCGAPLAFFFQVACPTGHPWAGFSLAVFACVSCWDEEHLVPKAIDPLPGHKVPEGFFDDYETFFRFLVFETAKGVMLEEYAEQVKFYRWELGRALQVDHGGNRIGGKPYWVDYAREPTPSTYKESVPLVFLMQLEEDLDYEIIEGAPHQMMDNLLTKQLEPVESLEYVLFLGNPLYLFGTDDKERHVYAIL